MKENANRFDYTPAGCTKAKAYLKEIGEEDAIQRERSTDGWSIVHLANHLWRKRQRDQFKNSA